MSVALEQTIYNGQSFKRATSFSAVISTELNTTRWYLDEVHMLVKINKNTELEHPNGEYKELYTPTHNFTTMG